MVVKEVVYIMENTIHQIDENNDKEKVIVTSIEKNQQQTELDKIIRYKTFCKS